MLFIEYPKCSTCQKAKKWLDDNNISYIDRHIKEDNPTYEEIKKWHQISGLPLKKFFNVSGLLYKELDLKNISRVRVAGKDKVNKDFDYWIKYFEENPEEKYVSDGDPTTFVINSSDKDKVNVGVLYNLKIK